MRERQELFMGEMQLDKLEINSPVRHFSEPTALSPRPREDVSHSL